MDSQRQPPISQHLANACSMRVSTVIELDLKSDIPLYKLWVEEAEEEIGFKKEQIIES